MMTKKSIRVVGWREWIRLPELCPRSIKVKVDTGARTSALHAFDVESFSREGVEWVRFQIHPDQHSDRRIYEAQSAVLEYRTIKNSGGTETTRPVIVTPIKMFGSVWPIELTLSNRDPMGFRMLLGREAIRDRFLVDASGSYFNGKPKRRKKPDCF